MHVDGCVQVLEKSWKVHFKSFLKARISLEMNICIVNTVVLWSGRHITYSCYGNTLKGILIIVCLS